MRLPLYYKLGHIYVIPSITPTSLFFTEEHRGATFPIPSDWHSDGIAKGSLTFFHPTATKLYNLIRLSRPYDEQKGLRQFLYELSSSCDTCQELSTGPTRFKVSMLTDNILFNHEVAIDLLWLSKQPVLQVIDIHRCFNHAAFIGDKTPSGLWDTFLSCWTTLYCGFPPTLRLDR